MAPSIQAPTVLVVHGPNLNMLGVREPEIYGTATLGEIDASLRNLGQELGLTVETFQSNHEGAIVDKLQEASNRARAVVINPAAYTHTSVAIRDALQALNIPVVEIHLSNIYRREPFRRKSLIAPAVTGQISGLGAQGYLLALRAAAELVKTEDK